MPLYAPDLSTLLTEMGDNRPTQVLEDPELMRRALSAKSPITLVGKVVECLGDVDAHPAIAELNDYERGRIMTVLGRSEDAQRLYQEAIETTSDPQIVGLSLINLAGELDDPVEQERLLKIAIDIHRCLDAYAYLGEFYFHEGRVKEAIEVLMFGITLKVEMCLPILAGIYAKTCSEKELLGKMLDLFDFAKQAGIENTNRAFEAFPQNVLARSKDTGRIINLSPRFLMIRNAVLSLLGMLFPRR